MLFLEIIYLDKFIFVTNLVWLCQLKVILVVTDSTEYTKENIICFIYVEFHTTRYWWGLRWASYIQQGSAEAWHLESLFILILYKSTQSNYEWYILSLTSCYNNWVSTRRDTDKLRKSFDTVAYTFAYVSTARRRCHRDGSPC